MFNYEFNIWEKYILEICTVQNNKLGNLGWRLYSGHV